tara:strand:- start:397 stop:810 length:414 start_codon:yes stop_codon:yes gene_type:complete
MFRSLYIVEREKPLLTEETQMKSFKEIRKELKRTSTLKKFIENNFNLNEIEDMIKERNKENLENAMYEVAERALMKYYPNNVAILNNTEIYNGCSVASANFVNDAVEDVYKELVPCMKDRFKGWEGWVIKDSDLIRD